MMAIFDLSSVKLTVLLMIIVAFLPYVCTILAKKSAGFQAADNANPRALLATATGRAARLDAAQQNSFEGLPLFYAAVLIALYTFVPVTAINYLALGYLMMRIVYIYAYARDYATFRSIVWFLGLAQCLALMVIALMMAW